MAELGMTIFQCELCKEYFRTTLSEAEDCFVRAVAYDQQRRADEKANQGPIYNGDDDGDNY